MHDLHDSWSVSKERTVIIFAHSDTSIGLRVSQIPRCSEVALFVLTTDDDRQNRLLDPLRMRAGNNLYQYILYM